ncbi:MAG TPA: ATP-binding cassette domain-containing protein, partial [Candidatus Binatia bacterium]|nr:ATP-binding cassette domain-containing protein [Candidatus Binatia bacterium]
RGIKLSGGESQRVGIARALIKNPSILIFDEATSNLDAENEALIKEAMAKSSVGRTTIIIAHRLSTVRDADKILVVDDGQIVGEGKHDELMQTCSVYIGLIAHQTEFKKTEHF